jgi:hypothetical protein
MKRARSIQLLLPGLLFWLSLNGCEGCLEENPLGSETNPYPDQTPPKVSFAELTDNATLVRLEQPIDIEASDPPRPFRGPLSGHEKISGLAKVELFVSETLLEVDTRPPWGFTWKTKDYADGRYTLNAVAHDSAGNTGNARIAVRLENTIVIEEVQLTGVEDNSSATDPLEAEVHLFDSSHRFLGCTGDKSGMAEVDFSGILYRLDAYFHKSSREPVAFSDLMADTVYFELIENDIDPCPDPSRGSGLIRDDLVGRSPRIAVTALTQPRTFQFDKVAHLKMRKGRPK